MQRQEKRVRIKLALLIISDRKKSYFHLSSSVQDNLTGKQPRLQKSQLSTFIRQQDSREWMPKWLESLSPAGLRFQGQSHIKKSKTLHRGVTEDVILKMQTKIYC